MEEFYNHAYAHISSPQARAAFELNKESGQMIKRGLIYGSTDATASEPEENPVRIEDLMTTVYHQLGINADKELMAPGRNRDGRRGR